MTTLDWIILAGLALFFWNGYRMGLINQLMKIASLAASYFISRTYAPDLAPFVEKQLSHFSLFRSISTNNNAPGELLNQPDSLSQSDILGTYQQSLQDSATQAVHHVALYSLSYVISYAILFTLGYMVIRVVGTVLDGFFSLPILSFVNRTVGALFGLVFVVLLEAILLHLALVLPIHGARTLIDHSSLAQDLLHLRL